MHAKTIRPPSLRDIGEHEQTWHESKSTGGTCHESDAQCDLTAHHQRFDNRETLAKTLHNLAD